MEYNYVQLDEPVNGNCKAYYYLDNETTMPGGVLIKIESLTNVTADKLALGDWNTAAEAYVYKAPFPEWIPE